LLLIRLEDQRNYNEKLFVGMTTKCFSNNTQA